MEQPEKGDIVKLESSDGWVKLGLIDEADHDTIIMYDKPYDLSEYEVTVLEKAS